MYKITAFIEPHYPLRRAQLVRASQKTLEASQVKGKVELAISVIGDRKMRSLNKQFRGEDTPTDVLAFPYNYEKDETSFPGSGLSNYLNLGDVIISYPQLLSRAAKENTLVDEMANILVIHGVLHLLGHDHEREEDARRMEALEDQILSELQPVPEIIK